MKSSGVYASVIGIIAIFLIHEISESVSLHLLGICDCSVLVLYIAKLATGYINTSAVYMVMHSGLEVVNFFQGSLMYIPNTWR
jgi:hypothetical protein